MIASMRLKKKLKENKKKIKLTAIISYAFLTYLVYRTVIDIINGLYIIAFGRYLIVGGLIYGVACLKYQRIPNPLMIITWPIGILSVKFKNYLWKDNWSNKIKEFVRRDEDA